MSFLIRCCPRRRSWQDFVWSLSLPRLAISIDHMHSLTSLCFILLSSRFFHVCFGFPLLPRSSNFKAFTITFSSTFLKTVIIRQVIITK